MACLWRCFRRQIATHKLNEIEGVALLSADHSIVTLDANEDDLVESRGVTDEIQKLTSLLSTSADSMDEGFKSKLKGYVHTHLKTVAQENILGSINISSREVAQNMLRKVGVDQRRTELEYLLGAVVDPEEAASAVVSTQPTRQHEITAEYIEEEEEEGEEDADNRLVSRKAVLA
jgi:hypothetical protein